MVSLLVIWEYVQRGNQGFASWLIQQVQSFDLGLTDALVNDVPKTIGLENVLTPSLMGLIVQWFPLSYAVTCFGIYLVIAGTVYIVNWILGLVPTVS